jgi:hypothetical protein
MALIESVPKANLISRPSGSICQAEHREPRASRGSSTVLETSGGKTPPGDSPFTAELFSASAYQCPLRSDFVAKVGGPLQVRNYRIKRARHLNQSCATDQFLESKLRVGMRKMFLQQYPPLATKMVRRSE